MCLCSIVRQDVWCTDTCAYNVSRFLVPIAHHMLLSCMHDKSIVRKWWSLALYTSLDFTYMWLHHSNVVITWLVPVCNVQLELEILKWLYTHTHTHMNTHSTCISPSPPRSQSSRASSTATSVGSGVTFSLPDESPQGLSQGGMAGRLDAIIESQCLESPPPVDQHHALHRQSSVYDSTTTYKLFQKAMQVGKR